MKRALLCLAVLAFVPSATAAAVQLESDSVLLVETSPSNQAGAFDYAVHFVVDANRTGYVKVLPAPGNPVHLNGTIDGTGWWTEVLRNTSRLGATNGSDIVELGALAKGRHNLTLRVHTPAGAVRAPTELRLKYALAVRSENSGSGSGGNLDPSVSVQPLLRVKEAPLPPDEGGPADTKDRFNLDRTWILAGLGVAAIALVFWAGRKSAKKGGPSQ